MVFLTNLERRPFSNSNTPGQAKPIIDSVYKFDDVLSAYGKILTGHARGKIVVEIA